MHSCETGELVNVIFLETDEGDTTRDAAAWRRAPPFHRRRPPPPRPSRRRSPPAPTIPQQLFKHSALTITFVNASSHEKNAT